jgi:histone demethylase
MSTADSLHPSSPPGSRDDLDSEEPLFSDSSSEESYSHEAARRAADAFAASSSTPTSSPEPSSPPPSPAVLPLEDVFPATPSVFVSSPEEAFSPQLFEFCLQKPIVVVRNLNSVCNVDLSLYSTKKLVQCHPSHPVEMRTQMEQMSNENWDPTMTKQVWYCTSSRSYTTISKYAEYQSANFTEACQNTQTKSVNPDYDFSNKTTRRMIKFGTNCDLSDEKKWAPQLQELLKLPAWLRVSSAGNMLSHVGYQILGMNTVQLYMKVPCARTPGHQENNNFCGVNINIGPGDCEWFGVPNEHWEKIKDLCEDNSLNYLHGSWWPHISDLVVAKVPTYRFLQRPGDLVWVNAGCVHWVQATGWCNNIAWNVGPLTPRQYNLAMERFEWNKSQRFQSVVAMTSLSWNLARNIVVANQHLQRAIKATLQKSLEDIADALDLCRRRGVRIRFHGRRKTEACNYCGVCNEEVFNLLFVREEEKIPAVFCVRCALRQTPDLKGFVCLEEFSLEELYAVFDNFGAAKQKGGKMNGL